MTHDSPICDEYCIRCGTRLVPESTTCWLCYSEVESQTDKSGAAGEGATPKTARVDAKPERLGSYSLASLMMFVTLVAVVCGTLTIAPGLGILLAIVAALAFVRTAILVHRHSVVGHHPSAVERAILFAGSMAIVIVTGIAATTAFWATCSGGFLVGLAAGEIAEKQSYLWLWVSLGVGGILGTLVALYVGYRVFTLLSKSQRGIRLSRRNKLVLAVVLVLAIVVIIWLYLHNWRWDDLL